MTSPTTSADEALKMSPKDLNLTSLTAMDAFIQHLSVIPVPAVQ